MVVIRLLVLLVLATAIFGTAGYFVYDLYVKPSQLDRQEALAPPPTPPPDPSIAAYATLTAGKTTMAPAAMREALMEFLTAHPQSPHAAEARQWLGWMNSAALFSGEDGTTYHVAKGDSLVRIASKQNSSAELLYLVNNMESLRLQIGQPLIIPQLEVRIEVDEVGGTLTLYNRGEFFKEYALQSAKPAARHAKPKQTTVREKFALQGSKRVAFGDKAYQESERWIIFGTGGPLRATAMDPNAPAPGGILATPSDLQEIFLLVRPGTPVTLH